MPSSRDHSRTGRRDLSPAALYRRRTRAWFLAAAIGLGTATLVGFLLPVQGLTASDNRAEPQRPSRH